MSRQENVEIEACLAVVGDARAAVFERVIAASNSAGLQLGAWERRELHDRYFDLEGGLLAQASSALRWRTCTSRASSRDFLTLKGPAQGSDPLQIVRAEYEAEWSDAGLRSIIAHLPELGCDAIAIPPGSSAAPERALQALGFQLIQARTTTRLLAASSDDEGPAVELALDHVLYDLPGRQIQHRELEVEALRGGVGHRVTTVAQHFLARFPDDLRPWRWSKTALARALEVLHERGELADVLDGEELTRAGYDSVERVLEDLPPGASSPCGGPNGAN